MRRAVVYFCEGSYEGVRVYTGEHAAELAAAFRDGFSTDMDLYAGEGVAVFVLPGDEAELDEFDISPAEKAKAREAARR